ncbi:unnamed protein product [Gadus morhua 'NCC']
MRTLLMFDRTGWDFRAMEIDGSLKGLGGSEETVGEALEKTLEEGPEEALEKTVEEGLEKKVEEGPEEALEKTVEETVEEWLKKGL